MELDYIANINEFGDNVVRLYNFDKAEALQFKTLIEDQIINKKQKLDMSQIEFIETQNCNLILGLFKSDEGIFTPDNKTFYCALTLESYKKMLVLIEPFCKKDRVSYQYLYDVDNPTDLLFSPAGS